MTQCLNNCQCCNCNCDNSCPNYAIPGNQSKEIRVYGTLKNWTLDPQKSNGNSADPTYHNDALAYAYQLYDSRFFPDQTTIENYQDMINKRLTAISFADINGGVTTIENRDGSKGDPYMLIVNGNTNIGGDLHLDGDLYFKDEHGEYKPIDLSDILGRLEKLESMWEINPDDDTQIIAKVYNNRRRSAAAYGFYDVDPQMIA